MQWMLDASLLITHRLHLVPALLQMRSHALEEKLLEQALDKIEAEGRNNESPKIKSPQQKLRNHDNPVAVPTEKTNSLRTASKSTCCKWPECHLTKNANKMCQERNQQKSKNKRHN